MKPKDVPAIIPFRTKEKDRETIARLVTNRKPKNMTALIRAGLEKLDLEDQAKKL